VLGVLELVAPGLVAVAFGVAGVSLSLGLIRGPVAVTLAVGASTVAYSALLVVRALRIHASAGSYGPCRGVGFMGMGVLASGASLIAGALSSAQWASYVVAAGLVAAAGLFLLGLLSLPGAAPTITSRIRRVLDGSAIGISLFFAGWTFVVIPLSGGQNGPNGPNVLSAVLVLIVLSGSVAVASLTVLRASRHRVSAWFCGAGTAAALTLHSAVALLLMIGAGWQSVLAAGAVWAVGPVLVWVGARRSADRMPRTEPGERPVGRYVPATVPLLIGSSGLALLGATYHLFAYGPWGMYTAMIAAATATAVAFRGFFASIESSRSSVRLARQERRFLGTDPLTGLPNRMRLRHRLDAERKRVDVGQRCGTLLVIDLDNFGELDDVHGHDAGDAVLMETAKRLGTLAAPDDLVVRLAGDSFAVLTTTSPGQAAALASRLRVRLAEPYQPSGEPGTMHLTASVGVAECNAAAEVDEMIRCAELALSSAKERGGDRIEHYDESLQLRVLRRRTFAHELRGAVQRGELDLVFSPIVELAGGEPVGLRAQARWLHPSLGEVAAAELAVAAADTGLATDIGHWTLRHAIRQLGQWLAEGRDVWLTVEITAAQLRTPGFAGMVADLCRGNAVGRQRLALLVSEYRLPPAEACGPPLAALQNAGVRTGLADFGSGTVSLLDLRELPLDLLTMDESLVAELAGCEPIVATVADLARRLGLDVIAAGVSETWHAHLLRTEGCRYASGPRYSRPVPAERVEAYLDTHAGGADSADLRP
jgi:diguanylate cyclase (GGDEF)-like protein